MSYYNQTQRMYIVTMERIRDGKVRRVKVRASCRTEAESLAEINNRDYAAVDSLACAEPVRMNRFPTMLGN